MKKYYSESSIDNKIKILLKTNEISDFVNDKKVYIKKEIFNDFFCRIIQDKSIVEIRKILKKYPKDIKYDYIKDNFFYIYKKMSNKDITKKYKKYCQKKET